MKNLSKTDRSVLNSSINLQLEDYYKEVCQMLGSPKNYLRAVNLDNISDYLKFVSSALERPYNRIAHIAAFVRDEDGLMSSRMYPFSFLSLEAKSKIDTLYKEVETLVDSLGLSAAEAGTQALELEPHLAISPIEKSQINSFDN